jgi:alpha-ketoglutarate-dependent taurine dioxygenase
MTGEAGGGMRVTLQTRPLHPLLGVEIVGVDVHHLDADVFARIVDAFEEHSVLLFRGQTLDDDAQIAFSRRFGPLETTIRTVVSHARFRPEISNLANVDVTIG